MSQQTQMESRKRRRKRSKRLTSSRYKIRVRYKYHYYRWINTKDYGSYKDIYEKSKWYDPQTRPSLKKEWKPASELTRFDWVFFPIFKGNREADPELLYLLGLYMAEGYPTGKQVCFSLGHHERELAERICRMVARHWNVRATINSHRSGLSVRLSKESLANFMRKEFGSRAFNKKIPSWILEQRNPRPFLDGWIQGDGFRQGNTWRLHTSSPTAAYQALLIGSRLGIMPAIYRDDREGRHLIEGRRVNAKPSYEVRFHLEGSKFSNKESHVVRTRNGYWIRIKEIQREKFSGKVCNMETPSNTYLLSFIVHNCADLPPEFSNQYGTWTGYRLVGDKTHTASTL